MKIIPHQAILRNRIKWLHQTEKASFLSLINNEVSRTAWKALYIHWIDTVVTHIIRNKINNDPNME